MSASRALAFGDLDAGLWGIAWTPVADAQIPVAVGAGPEAEVLAATLTGTSEGAAWRLEGDGLELIVSPSAPPAAAGGSAPGLGGFDQLCRIEGQVKTGAGERVDWLPWMARHPRRSARARSDRLLPPGLGVVCPGRGARPGRAAPSRRPRPGVRSGGGVRARARACVPRHRPAAVDDVHGGRASRPGLGSSCGSRSGPPRTAMLSRAPSSSLGARRARRSAPGWTGRLAASPFTARRFAGTAAAATVPACTCSGGASEPRRGNHQRLRRRTHLAAARLVRGVPGLLGHLARAARQGDGSDRRADRRQPAVRARDRTDDRGRVPEVARRAAEREPGPTGRAARVRRALLRAPAPQRASDRLHARAPRARLPDGDLHQQRARVGTAVAGEATRRRDLRRGGGLGVRRVPASPSHGSTRSRSSGWGWVPKQRCWWTTSSSTAPPRASSG